MKFSNGVEKLGRITDETISLIVQIFPILGSCAELLDWLVPIAAETSATEVLTGLIQFAHYFPSTLCRPEDMRELPDLCNAPSSIPHNQSRNQCAEDLTSRFRSWSRLTGEWHINRNGSRKRVSAPRLPSATQLQRDLTSCARDLLRSACRTERWNSLVRQLQPGIWEIEGRRNGAAGVAGIGLNLLFV
jgi:hypothetical protein